MTTLSDFQAEALTGEQVDLKDFEGKVVLVVNTASQCGLTPQFEGLEQLYRELQEDGLVVLGFPSDSFKQEHDSVEQIAEVCQQNYGVSFPMFAPIEVNGPSTHPVFQWLKDEKKGMLGGAIKWNFTKFLVGRDGRVIERFAPTTTPAELRPQVEQALAA
ncbi:glutathione peroxidase [Agrococcus sp. Marseille-Q4369]|uniref:glutathione peroxidase n=1 Tax=Agrococcus sp. Marseille-Q4369 TaxID=2810513 RepID=UPI001B8C74CE|nr:glutathione peroxidase [Agrococcus sp. Marseille-Q4369]QUW17785.1 glutathione peroxidase [Agrococcus sp. Marseille-Q4369]